ncbi:hypothetical protein FRB91_007785 [Serendipita sp. 411]|nr:hypothetical protein FRB91_007785 [Serendipita sp. 411]
METEINLDALEMKTKVAAASPPLANFRPTSPHSDQSSQTEYSMHLFITASQPNSPALSTSSFPTECSPQYGGIDAVLARQAQVDVPAVNTEHGLGLTITEPVSNVPGRPASPSTTIPSPIEQVPQAEVPITGGPNLNLPQRIWKTIETVVGDMIHSVVVVAGWLGLVNRIPRHGNAV